MIERIYDPAVVNAVSNHWSIRPSICGGRGWLDATPFIANENNIYLAGEWGISIFHYVEPGLYEVHYRVLPEGRGKWALGFIHGCAAAMFADDSVAEIRARVPRGNYACRALVRCMCMQFEFTMKPGWVDEDGFPIEADVFSMTRSRWWRLNGNA